MSDSEDPKINDKRTITPPSQKPLLEDVIHDLNTPSALAEKSRGGKKPVTPDLDPLDKPLATDLFGDPIHSYAENPDNASPTNKEALKAEATQVVNSDVEEYSLEIVRRLHDDLTSVLSDLNEETPAPDRDDPSAPTPPKRDQ